MLSAEGAAASAVPVLAKLPRQPPPAALGCGLLHRADAHLQDAVRFVHPVSIFASMSTRWVVAPSSNATSRSMSIWFALKSRWHTPPTEARRLAECHLSIP